MQLLMKMFAETTFICLCLVISNGMFGADADADEVKSVMEGESITLNRDVTHIQTHDRILWLFGSQRTLIAEIIKLSNVNAVYDDDERFKYKIQLDSQTGSLTITNISITNSGLYTSQLQIIGNNKTSYKRFSVTVYERPFPSMSPVLLAVIVVAVVYILLGVIAGVIHCKRSLNYNHTIQKKLESDKCQLKMNTGLVLA